MKLGIRAKLFLISLGLILVSVIVAYAYMRSELERAVTDTTGKELYTRAELVAEDAGKLAAPLDDRVAWDKLADTLGERADARVTLIRRDGWVMGDSQVSLARLPSVENHAQRPEVQAALAYGRGESSRHSVTVDNNMLYVAVPLRRGPVVIGVARVATPLVQVDEAVKQLRSVLTIASLLALVVAVGMSSVTAQLMARTARSLTDAAQRMADGDLSVRTRQAGRDEFGDLGRALDHMARGLSGTLDELRTERDRLQGILAGMQEGVLLLDAAGRVVLVNPALREMLLLDADSAGKTPLELIRHAELKEIIDEAASSEQQVIGEIDLAGLKPRRLLVRAAPLPGEQSGVFAVFVDVTEMRRLETLRRDFVANVSHELRTPVTAIRSAAETLQAALVSDPESAAGFVDIIDRNAVRLHDLVEDLLDLSRIESREFRLAMEPVDLEPVFAHVLGLFRERATKRRVTLEHAVTGEPAVARVDRRALENVLANLVDNAVKYAGEGARVTVRAAADGGAVRVTVEDTGPGIEPRHLSRLFERFYRVDAGRSRELGGTGLGLSIVKHLVEAMGGSVGVESTPGRGTIFRVTLQAASPAA